MLSVCCLVSERGDDGLHRTVNNQAGRISKAYLSGGDNTYGMTLVATVTNDKTGMKTVESRRFSCDRLWDIVKKPQTDETAGAQQ